MAFEGTQDQRGIMSWKYTLMDNTSEDFNSGVTYCTFVMYILQYVCQYH